MVMIGGVGIVIGLARHHHRFPQQSRRSKLLKAIIDRGQGNLHPRSQNFRMELLRRNMAMVLRASVGGKKQQPRQGQPLPRGTEALLPPKAKYF